MKKKRFNVWFEEKQYVVENTPAMQIDGVTLFDLETVKKLLEIALHFPHDRWSVNFDAVHEFLWTHQCLACKLTWKEEAPRPEACPSCGGDEIEQKTPICSNCKIHPVFDKGICYFCHTTIVHRVFYVDVALPLESKNLCSNCKIRPVYEDGLCAECFEDGHNM